MLKIQTFIIALSLLITISSDAKTILQDKFNYEVRPESFLKKEINYSIQTYTYKKLIQEQSEIAEIVETVFPKSRQLNYILTKSSYLIGQSVADDSQEIFKDLDFFKQYFNASKVLHKKDYYEVYTSAFNYQHRIYYDSNDLSTLDQSRVMRSINLIKKLDVISLGSHLTIIHRKSKFSKVLNEGLVYQMFIPIRDRLTLVVNYGVFGTKMKKISKEDLSKSLKEELVYQQALLNKK